VKNEAALFPLTVRFSGYQRMSGAAHKVNKLEHLSTAPIDAAVFARRTWIVRRSTIHQAMPFSSIFDLTP
jgi:hypothetical protein